MQEVDAAFKSRAAAEELEHANVTAARIVAEESKAALYDELVAEFQQATASRVEGVEKRLRAA